MTAGGIHTSTVERLWVVYSGVAIVDLRLGI